jgi:uncharacterized YigZ family protein
VTSYRTLGGPIDLEIPKIKGSRFLAFAAPAPTDDDVQVHLAEVRKRHHAARHVCWARVLSPDGGDVRARDDGEPSGSAGKPILSAIRGRNLTFTVVAVVRYFGGTKLGVGGLARAYGGAAAEALDRAQIVQIIPSRRVTADLDYADLAGVRAFALKRDQPEVAADYAARVRLAWLLPQAAADPFAAALLDATHGRVSASVADLVENAPASLPAGDPT